MRRTYRRIWIVIRVALSVTVSVLFGQAEARLPLLDRSLQHQAPDAPQQAEPRTGTSGLQMVGQVGGPTQAVAVQGGYAYVAVGLRLVVLDVSDPAAPTEVGSTAPFPQFAEGVAVSGTLAYVADGVAGLRMVDVSDPCDPIEIGVYDTPGYAEEVTVAGGTAYVADGHYGLRIVDVSDPTAPAEMAYAYPLNYVFDAVVDGAHAYLAAAGAGLLVVDVSDPAHPIEIGACDTPGYAYGLDVADGVAYVADGWEHLRVVDVSDPAHSVEVGSCDTPGWSFGVEVVGDRAYMADAFAGLQVVDVIDPAQPRRLGGEEVSRGHAGRLVAIGNTVYVADRNRGLRVVDVSGPGTPTEIGFYGPLVVATAVAVSGDYAYVAAATYGLRVVDISDRAHPVEVGIYDAQAHVVGVEVVGNYAYVAASFREPGTGLHVVDVSDPAHPTGVGFCEPVGMPRDIAVAGEIAYIADEWGLQLIDVSLPYSPTMVGQINLQGEEWNATTGVAVSGTLAYVVQDAEGVRIVDVSSPVSPTLLSTFKDSEWTKGFGVAVTGTTAYVTHHGGDDLKIVDISDPLHPTQVGSYRGGAQAERVTVAGSTAYVAFGSIGLHAIDVTDPASPTLAFQYNTQGYAIASAVAGDLVYVADEHGGLAILETTASQHSSPTCRESRPAATCPLSTGAPASPPAVFTYRPRSRPTLRSSAESQGQGEFSTPHGLRLGPPPTRRAAGTCTVTSVEDAGPGTLRECVQNAVQGDTITFDPAVFPPSAPQTIALSSGLWIGQGNITLDGSNAGVVLDGSHQTDGLTLASDGNVVVGLQILNFSPSGIQICCGARDNVIGGDRSRGDGPTGEGNVISGSGVSGVHISDAGTMHNIVVGNLIGTDASGTLAMPNEWDGVTIENGASFNRIGGPAAWERNVIAGNNSSGVTMDSYVGNTMGNEVVGNFIGTDVTGMVDLGNAGTGVLLQLGAFDNTIKGNLVSGSNWGGIGVGDRGTEYNTVIGNLVGTDATGTRPLANRLFGVGAGERFNRVGGTSPGEGNVISGNPQGVVIAGEHNLVLGNLIGTNISGTAAIANDLGLTVMSGASRSYVGGSTSAERNVISGSTWDGIALGGGVRCIFVLGNAIGADADGMNSLPNGHAGVSFGVTEYAVIQDNLIGGNQESGVSIGEDSHHIQVRANRIGVAADGVSALPNGSDGVSISAAWNNVGGLYPGDGNVIAFNGNAGVQVWTYPGNTIRRNSIHDNVYAGISLDNGGNSELAAPVITTVTATAVSGTACPGCTVEIFSDDQDEGRIYEGTAIAAVGDGNWAWVGTPTGPHVTATTTDEAGNTSAFSAARMVWQHRVYLPLVMRR